MLLRDWLIIGWSQGWIVTDAVRKLSEQMAMVLESSYWNCWIGMRRGASFAALCAIVYQLKRSTLQRLLVLVLRDEGECESCWYWCWQMRESVNFVGIGADRWGRVNLVGIGAERWGRVWILLVLVLREMRESVNLVGIGANRWGRVWILLVLVLRDEGECESCWYWCWEMRESVNLVGISAERWGRVWILLVLVLTDERECESCWY